MRPVSSSGRPLQGLPDQALSGGRTANFQRRFRRAPWKARPMTSLGRRVRLGTASMLSDHGLVHQRRQIKRAKVRPQTISGEGALRLPSVTTTQRRRWNWRQRRHRSQTSGLVVESATRQSVLPTWTLQDAERQFKSQLGNQDMVVTARTCSAIFGWTA